LTGFTAGTTGQGQDSGEHQSRFRVGPDHGYSTPMDEGL
jgi:hypothetical protein